MIDLTHNEATGITLVHDEPFLDGIRSLLLSPDGGLGVVAADGHVRMMARHVPPSLRPLLAGHDEATLIRVDGDAAAASSTVKVRHIPGGVA